MQLDAKIPAGPLEEKWDRHRFDLKLVNPANKRKFEIIVVGTGLAGGSASASLAELGYNVKTFCIQDSPRRAHSIAAQGGINAAKNYPNDGDSIWRLFYDTIKGGDFRAREGQCLSPGPGQQPDHRPLRGPGDSLCPGIRRAAGQPLLRRRPGVPDVLCPGADRPATAAGGLQRPDAPGGPGPGHHVPPPGDAGPGAGGRPGPGHRGAEPDHRGNRTPCGPRRGPGHRRLRQCLLSVHQRHGLQCDREPGAPTRRGRDLPTPVLPRFIPPASRCTATISPS